LFFGAESRSADDELDLSEFARQLVLRYKPFNQDRPYAYHQSSIDSYISADRFDEVFAQFKDFKARNKELFHRYQNLEQLTQESFDLNY